MRNSLRRRKTHLWILVNFVMNVDDLIPKKKWVLISCQVQIELCKGWVLSGGFGCQGFLPCAFSGYWKAERPEKKSAGARSLRVSRRLRMEKCLNIETGVRIGANPEPLSLDCRAREGVDCAFSSSCRAGNDGCRAVWLLEPCCALRTSGQSGWPPVRLCPGPS